MHDSYTPLGRAMIPMWLMQARRGFVFREASASGPVRHADVRDRRRGSSLGSWWDERRNISARKIEAFEMKMASLVILIPPLVVLTGDR